jgi:hypothetical protein
MRSPKSLLICLVVFTFATAGNTFIKANDLAVSPEAVFPEGSQVQFISESNSIQENNSFVPCGHSSSGCSDVCCSSTCQTSTGCGTCGSGCGTCGNGCGCGSGCGSLLNLDSIFGCGSGCNCGCGLITSDHEFDRFIEPVSNPVYFEDPRSRTRLRFLFINQMIPESSILGGGDFQVYGLEATIALSNRLSIIAQKDGYISLQADGLDNDDGWADLATGLKYVLIRDVCNQFILSGGAVYEWSNGSSRVFQGNGDGNWSFFLTGGKEFGNFHFITTAGWRIPVDGAQESESIYHSHHLDYALTEKLYALVEYNGILYTESGSRLAVNVEGGDLINLGASNVAGNYFASMAFGSTYKFNKHLECAAAYEIPITGREDLMDNRITSTISLIY